MLTTEQLRALWAQRQCLTEQAPTVREAALRGGWPRTLGGVEAYLALAARCPAATVEAVDAAVAAGDLAVTPAVRGCIYLVPRDHAGVALAIAEEQARPRLEKDTAKAGLSAAEIAEVGEAVVEALAGAPLSTDALRGAIPSSLLRPLGDAGKKVGISSALPPALRHLEWDGRIARTMASGRVDTERYLWRAATGRLPAPSGAALHAEVARIFLAQAAPATLDELAAWSGLGKRDAKAALAAVGAVPVPVEGGRDAFVLPGDPMDAPPPTTATRLLPVLDNYVVWRAGLAPLADPRHHDLSLDQWGALGPKRLADVAHPFHRLIVIGGSIAGVWEWDAGAERVVWRTFDPAPEAAAAAIAPEAERAATIIRTLGHARAVSIDNVAAIARRAAFVTDGALAPGRRV